MNNDRIVESNTSFIGENILNLNLMQGCLMFKLMQRLYKDALQLGTIPPREKYVTFNSEILLS